jgi:membrane protein
MAVGRSQSWLRPGGAQAAGRVASHVDSIAGKFFRDRGPHLAAMVAYYALLSLVPFLFLTLSLVGLAGRPSAGSYLIRELSRILPGQSAHDLVHLVATIQKNAGTIGVIGLVGMLWSSLGFYSALESALNLVFEVPNRTFLRGKWLGFTLVLTSSTALFASLVAATTATAWVGRHAAHLIDLQIWVYVATLLVSSLGIFVFLMVVYRVLPNVPLHRGDVWPGALFGTILFQLSFQALPLYLRFSDQLYALRAFGGLAILLVWLYLMANIVILGAEINWSHWVREQRAEEGLTGLA